MTRRGSDTPTDEQLAWALHRLASEWASADAARARELGLPSGDYLALVHIAASEGMGPAELARRLGMSTGSVNALINRLQRAGHLDRRAHASDRRRLLLTLTEPTRVRMADLYREQLAAFSRSADLDDVGRRAVLAFLENPAWRSTTADGS